ncbi:sporulation delaying protein family toxin [Pyxidicoccus fallax]|nr:sporulation delaying protein family toxin [Pyxidicoccus fallax]
MKSKWAGRSAVSLMLSGLMLVGGPGCGGGMGPDDSRQAARVAYDGETVFRGVLFGLGPVGSALPEIWEEPHAASVLRNPDRSAAAAALADKIVARIQQQDPSFFGRFGADIQSGDHLRVSSALKEAGDVTLAAAAAEQGTTVQALRDKKAAAIDVCVGEEVVVQAYVAAVVVAVAMAVVVVVALAPEDGGSEAMKVSGLERDVWVQLLVERLGPGDASAAPAR